MERADECFTDGLGPVLTSDADVATFGEGGSWRVCNETGSMVQLAARDARIPPPDDRAEEEEDVDVEDLLDVIFDADQAADEFLHVDGFLDGLLDVHDVEEGFVHADELIDDLFAADLADYERTHMALIARFVAPPGEDVAGAVEAALNSEEDMVEQLIESLIEQDIGMADVAVAFAFTFKEKVRLIKIEPRCRVCVSVSKFSVG